MSIRGPSTPYIPIYITATLVSLSVCCLVFSGWFIFSVCTLFQARNDSAYAPIAAKKKCEDASSNLRGGTSFMNSLVFAFHLVLFACLTHGFEKRQDSSSNITSKAGVAWPNGATVSLKQFEGTGKSYLVRHEICFSCGQPISLSDRYYTWSAYPIDNNIEFVPMFWGKTSIEVWTNTAKKVLATMSPKVTAVLGMNESVTLLTCTRYTNSTIT